MARIKRRAERPPEPPDSPDEENEPDEPDVTNTWQSRLRDAGNLFVWFVALSAGVVLIVIATTKQVRDGNDFPIYWQAAREFLAGRSPYDVTSGLHGYVYLPWFALLLAPLAMADRGTAISMWLLANVLFVSYIVRELTLALRAAGLEPRMRVILLATVPLAGLAVDNVMLGQANIFLVMLVALAVRESVQASLPRSEALPAKLSTRIRGVVSRAALGLAAALKMSAAVLLLPLAIRARWRAVATFAATVALAIAIPFLVTGPDRGLRLLGDWHAKVVAPAAAGTLQGSKVIDQSPHAGLRRLLVAEPAFGGTSVNVASLSTQEFANVSRGVAVLLLAGYVLVWLKAPARATPRALLLDLALGCCAMVQVTGFNLKAQFIVLLLPAWVAATIAWGEPSRRMDRVWLVLAGALFLPSWSDLVGRATSNLLLAYSSMAIGTLLLAVVLAMQRFAVATPSPSDARTVAPAPGTAP